MANIGQMTVKIVGDNSELNKAINTSKQKMAKFGQDMQRVGRSLTMFVTLPILGLAAGFVKAASDAEETNSKFNAVFKEQAAAVRTWADDFSEATGRSQTATIGFLASIQDLFVPLGATREAAADFAKEVVTLATDMSSFNNLPTADVMRDIESTLVGNFETTRKYGVVLSAAKVEQEAFNRGLIQEKNELTPLIRAQVALQLIIEGTVDAQGDAIRTSESMANQLVALKSGVIDLAISFGNQLIPFVQEMVTNARALVGWLTDLNPVTKNVILVIGGLAAAIGPLLFFVGALTTKIAALNIAMLANPAVLVTTAIVGLAVAIGVYAAKALSATAEAEKLNEEMRETRRVATEAMQAVSGLTNAQEIQLKTARLLAIQQEISNGRLAFAKTLYDQGADASKALSAAFRLQLELETDLAILRGEDGRTAAQIELDALIATRIELNENRIPSEVMLRQAIQERINLLVDFLKPATEEEEEDIENLVVVIDKETKALGESIKARALLGLEITNNHDALVEEARARAVAIQKYDDWVEAHIKNKDIIIEDEEEIIQQIRDNTLESIALRNSIFEDQREHNERMAALLVEYLDKDDEVTEEIIDHWQDVFSTITSLSSSLTTILNNNASKQADAAIAALGEVVFAEDATAEERKAIQEEYDMAVRAIRREEAGRRKSTAMFQVTIAGIIAVIEAFPNAILMALAGIQSAAALAAVASTPLPALAAGGIVTQPTTAIVGEGGQPEVIFPLDKLQDFLGGTDGQGQHLTINFDGQVIWDGLLPATRDRRAMVDVRAIV